MPKMSGGALNSPSDDTLKDSPSEAARKVYPSMEAPCVFSHMEAHNIVPQPLKNNTENMAKIEEYVDNRNIIKKMMKVSLNESIPYSALN